MRCRYLTLALVALLVAATAPAQLSQGLADFPKSPAGFLMTASELKAFAELKTDAEATTFIDLFWAKRDPNLDTVFNEYRADFEARVAAADKQFGWGEGNPGSLSDRARVFYVMGIPSAPVENFAAPPVDDDRPIAAQRGATQIWKYAKVALPKDKGDFVQFVFAESKAGVGDYILDRGDRRNKEAFKVLPERQEKLVLNPKLTEVPRAGLVTGTKAATTAQLAVLSVEPRPWPEGAQILAVSGLQSESVHPIWLHVDLPDAVAPATEAVGRVSKKDGAEVGTFFTPVTAASMAGSRAYEFSIPIDPGDYKVEIALSGAAGPLAVRTVDTTVEPTGAGSTYISAMFPSVGPTQEPGFKLGDPFNVGGWRSIPRVSNRYSSSEQLAYFCYVVKPGLDEAGNPKYTLGLKLFIDGKPAGEKPGQPVSLSKLSESIYMFGSALPLSSFAKPGEYKLELILTDQVSKVSRTSPILVVIPGAAPKP